MAASTVFCLLISALVPFARAIPKCNCAYGYYGDLSGVAVPLNDIRLNPPITSWDITITNACDVAGVMIEVCDPDSPPLPTVNILSKNEAIITRNGSPIKHNAMVYTTVYCSTNKAQINSVKAVPKDDGMKPMNHYNNIWD